MLEHYIKIISEDIEDLNNVINQINITNIYKKLYPTPAEYTLFPENTEHTLRQNMCWVIKQAINLKVSFLITVELNYKSITKKDSNISKHL